MSVTNPPIVVVGFNRPVSLKRILASLNQAYYPEHTTIKLIISIDKSDTNKEVLAIAENFEWKFGEKTVNYQKENLGLRKHIIQCGNYSLKYESVIILEDDLFVSPNFYLYAQKALGFSNDKKYIGGVSLYNHQLNVHTKDTFTPLDDGFDNYYFQFASSWGQAWTKNQWQNFTDWYGTNPVLESIENMPAYVKSWSNKSWLKYFIGFLIETNTFFIYPKVSLTTNFSDAGTHISNDSTIYQVPLFSSKKINYNFSTLDESDSQYNAFYENMKLSKVLGYTKDDICIDLYGYRSNPKKRYWLSSKQENYKILKSYTRSLKPMELNIVYNLQGNNLFLYDTSIKEKNTFTNRRHKKMDYNFKHILYKDLSYLFFRETRLKFRRIVKKIFKL